MDSSDDINIAEEWYSHLGDLPSQGDIVDVIPQGIIDEPLTICQPHNTDPQGKARYYPYASLPQRRSVEFIHAKGSVGLGMVVWPDCQIDKMKNQGRPQNEWIVGIAPIHPMTRLEAKVRERVADLGRAQYFPLPPNPPAIGEISYVDLRFIWTVRFSLLDRRRVALSEAARQALAFHLFWFQTEVRVSEAVVCPHCARQIDSSAFFEFKDGGEAG
jgi:hypothetical protein